MTKPNSIRYEMIQSTEYVEDSGVVTSYGISCREEKQRSGHLSVNVQRIANISTEPAFVQELIEKLICSDADPVHLRDIIEDHLP
ncbi:MAG: DUF6514 family protein [Clostridiales bacterium]|nr:DUF6514 family protein [Clostridiales bacterium]